MKKNQLKTFAERASYLASINPKRSEIYAAIAEFFGEDEIPPEIKKKIKSFRITRKC